MHFKPGSITNLVKETRLLKTALLLNEKVYTDNAGLDSLYAVYSLDDNASTIQQYKTILNAMPALDPNVNIIHLQENLAHVIKLRQNNRRSSREIVGLKKALKQLDQVNNTFKIVTETLFRVSGYSSLAPLHGKKIFLDIPEPIFPQREYLHIFDEDLCDGILPATCKEVDKDSANENGEFRTFRLLDDLDLVNFSTASILKSQPSAQVAILELMRYLKSGPAGEIWSGIEEKVKDFRAKIPLLPLKRLSKKIKTPSEVSLCLGMCSSRSFQELLKNTAPTFPSIPNYQGYITFLFQQAIIKEEDQAEQPVLLRQN